MQYSYSRVETYLKCPCNFKYKYVDEISKISFYEYNDARICGNAIHTMAEKGFKDAITFYKNSFPILNNNHINEIIKIENIRPKLESFLSVIDNCIHEYVIDTPHFKGIIDLIIKNSDGTVDIIDFKYSNNVDRYMESGQLHVYKYFLEQQGFKVNKLGFLFIPKVQIRQKKTENLYEFRKRLIHEVQNKELILIEVPYNHTKVEKFLNAINEINNKINSLDPEFTKNKSKLCDWCDYKELCMKGNDALMLPINQRRTKEVNLNPDFWIYADSYVGKSTFVDKIDNLLFLNTDGKIKNTTSPYIHIADEVLREGRTEKKILAWQKFLDVIAELEKKENSFEAIALDLIEDLYEHCRLWVFEQNKWEHEADGGFGKGYDIVKLEFLSTIKRLKNLGYQIVYISKEVKSEVTTRAGGSYTTYAPNIKPAIANVLSGTVDLTVRAYVEGRNRYLDLSKNEDVFGGGIYDFQTKKIELDMNTFKNALKVAQGDLQDNKVNTPVNEETTSEKAIEVIEGEPIPFDEEPPRRARRSRG